MSVLSRLQSMGEDGTELNLDGISKPNLNEIKSKADTITGMSDGVNTYRPLPFDL